MMKLAKLQDNGPGLLPDKNLSSEELKNLAEGMTAMSFIEWIRQGYQASGNYLPKMNKLKCRHTFSHEIRL